MRGPLASGLCREAERPKALRERLARVLLLRRVGGKVRRMLTASGYEVWPAEQDYRWRAWVADHGDLRLRSFASAFDKALAKRRAAPAAGDGGDER
jgi:hypothetical protein